MSTTTIVIEVQMSEPGSEHLADHLAPELANAVADVLADLTEVERGGLRTLTRVLDSEGLER